MLFPEHTKSNNKVTDFANEVALLLVSVSPGPRGKGTKENQKEKERDKKKDNPFLNKLDISDFVIHPLHHLSHYQWIYYQLAKFSICILIHR